MNDLTVYTDTDFRQLLADKALSDYAGPLLARRYPGYRWRIDPYSHPTKPFFTIRLEHAGFPLNIGYNVKPADFPTASLLQAEVLKGGGQLLETAGLNRRAFDEAEFLNRPKDFAGHFIVSRMV